MTYKENEKKKDMGNKTILLFLFLIGIGIGTVSAQTPQEQLGKLIFTDTSLSTPAGQSCQSCHDPNFAFTDPDQNIGVSAGATQGLFGNRNAPSVKYAAMIPDFSFAGGIFTGGLFWDGRATNLTEQAKGPFLNPLEMNNANPTEVLNKINASAYSVLFNQVCGTQKDKFTCVANAIAAFEKTPELNKFNSKFDVGPAGLTAQEQRGLALFTGKASCVFCHPEPTFFTDFDYANIGVPSNLGMLSDSPELQTYFPFYYPPIAPTFNPSGLNFVDMGLAGNPNVPLVQRSATRGKIKAPTLRNVEKTAPYMHNGVFKTLKDVIHFYNTRDVLGNCVNNPTPNPGTNCWPAPEVSSNINMIIGNLGLTDSEENDIVAFLKTLTDDFVQQSPPGISDKEKLGKLLFTDTSLSTPAGQSCQSCHDPNFAFTDPDQNIGVSAGATQGLFGNRNAPSITYVSNVPDFGIIAGKEFVGGLFWDGRASNLVEQAKGPFLNPIEMNNADPTEVLNKVQVASYADLFNSVCGDQPDQYTCLAEAIASFEKTKELNKFNSKFDQNPSLTGLTAQEQRGLLLFDEKARCSVCHPGPYFFTDFDYANIGAPSNLGMLSDSPELQTYFPFYYPLIAPTFNPSGLNFVDIGLAGNPNVPPVQQPLVKGMMKAPTLRNVEKTAPYMHNGVFKTLKEVVHFYNTRDVLGNCANNPTPNPGTNCWPAPEVPETKNIIIGSLGLSDSEENDIVAFLKTLTDDFVPQILSGPTQQEQLGKLLFTDTSLSSPAGQSCQSCHDPAIAFTDHDKNVAASEGAVAGRFGNRNAPSVLHSALIPDFSFEPDMNIFVGGLFWDGRAANLVEQAKGPFLNPLEMNNPDPASVINKVQAASYASLYRAVCDSSTDKFTCIANAIAAFEKTPELNKFNSRFDTNQDTLSGLTIQEKRGFALFSGKGACNICHRAPYFFTDYDFENIGVPSNLAMLGDTKALQSYFPFYYEKTFNPSGLSFVDIGLAGNPNAPPIQQTAVRGLNKAPTLRNVELTSPYMHNGVFRNLKEVVHFYNTRDILGDCAKNPSPKPGVNCWPAPEIPANVNPLIGNLGLSDSEENDIVAFLKTITDKGIAGPFSISGTVTNKGAPLDGVTLTMTGKASSIVVTDSAGRYTFTGLFNGSYTITPSYTNFRFNPSRSSVTIKGANVAGINFKTK